jgi:hypothetical protein
VANWGHRKLISNIHEDIPMRMTIRLGAAHNSVTIDGHTFDRSGLTRSETREFNRQVVEAYTQANARPKRRRRRGKTNAR